MPELMHRLEGRWVNLDGVARHEALAERGGR
jgi:hypothetical protein